MNNVNLPIIPKNITVHLGIPDSNSENITVNFIDYIKNVASNEIYPAWPTEAIIANVLAQISFALNRIYNEWYKSLGYDYDITSDPKYDQKFKKNSNIYESISIIVDEYFNKYLVRENQVQPLFAQYCDGQIADCSGLKQWGSFELANQGKNYEEILKIYYGDNIYIVNNAKQEEVVKSYPGYELKIGDAGNDILIIKRQLNRIKRSYPSLLLINIDEYFDTQLEDAIKDFQNVFNLPITGIINEATWYKIKYIYNSVLKITNIYSEGISIDDASLKFSKELKLNDFGTQVKVLNYFLNTIAYFDDEIIGQANGETFNENTKSLVTSFQKKYKLNQNGVVDSKTWLEIKKIYDEIIKSIPVESLYPGYILSKGMIGEDILILQNFLYNICINTKSIPGVKVSGYFDQLTKESIKKIQSDNGLEVSGNVGALTWYYLAQNSVFKK